MQRVGVGWTGTVSGSPRLPARPGEGGGPEVGEGGGVVTAGPKDPL